MGVERAADPLRCSSDAASATNDRMRARSPGVKPGAFANRA
jgi:hypothetical protein